jgi:CHASE2 domain-containing sensor protein
MAFWRKIYNPHAAIITIIVFLFIWLFQIFFFSRHFLDPFNNGLRDYEITDIVYSRFRNEGAGLPVQDIILLNSGLPDRATLAAILRRLVELEPAVVALDIELDGRRDPHTDSLLKAAIDALPKVVLGCRLTEFNEKTGIFAPPAFCDPYFWNGKARGYTNFVSEDTSIIRLFSPLEQTTEGEFYSLAVETVRQFAPDKIDRLLKRGREVERIWYAGNQKQFFKLERSLLLSDEGFQSLKELGSLKGKIIMIGYVGDHQPGEPEIDRFFTPLNPRYTGKSYPDMYGLEIHANIASMVLSEKYVYQMPEGLTELAGWLFCFVNVLLFHWVYINVPQTFHGITRFIQLVELVGVFFFIALFFYYFRVQINFSHGILAMLLSYDFIMIYESLIKKKIKILQTL